MAKKFCLHSNLLFQPPTVPQILKKTSPRIGIHTLIGVLAFQLAWMPHFVYAGGKPPPLPETYKMPIQGIEEMDLSFPDTLPQGHISKSIEERVTDRTALAMNTALREGDDQLAALTELTEEEEREKGNREWWDKRSQQAATVTSTLGQVTVIAWGASMAAALRYDLNDPVRRTVMSRPDIAVRVTEIGVAILGAVVVTPLVATLNGTFKHIRRWTGGEAAIKRKKQELARSAANYALAIEGLAHHQQGNRYLFRTAEGLSELKDVEFPRGTERLNIREVDGRYVFGYPQYVPVTEDEVDPTRLNSIFVQKYPTGEEELRLHFYQNAVDPEALKQYRFSKNRLLRYVLQSNAWKKLLVFFERYLKIKLGLYSNWTILDLCGALTLENQAQVEALLQIIGQVSRESTSASCDFKVMPTEKYAGLSVEFERILRAPDLPLIQKKLNHKPIADRIAQLVISLQPLPILIALRIHRPEDLAEGVERTLYRPFVDRYYLLHASPPEESEDAEGGGEGASAAAAAADDRGAPEPAGSERGARLRIRDRQSTAPTGRARREVPPESDPRTSVPLAERPRKSQVPPAPPEPIPDHRPVEDQHARRRTRTFSELDPPGAYRVEMPPANRAFATEARAVPNPVAPGHAGDSDMGDSPREGDSGDVEAGFRRSVSPRPSYRCTSCQRIKTTHPRRICRQCREQEQEHYP